MKEFKDLLFKQHPTGMGGFQATMEFENGYGVSVVCGEYRYSTPRTNLYAASMYEAYEVAILKNGSLCYDTSITDDVIGYVSPEEISKIMGLVQNL